MKNLFLVLILLAYVGCDPVSGQEEYTPPPTGFVLEQTLDVENYNHGFVFRNPETNVLIILNTNGGIVIYDPEKY